MTTSSLQEPEDPWQKYNDSRVSYTTTGPVGSVIWTDVGTPVISTGESVTWSATSHKPPSETKRVQWPYPDKREDPLPHPRRYLDGEKTRCPDCGAVTRDPSVLLTFPCKVVTPKAREIDLNQMDHITVHEPAPQHIGETWFDPSKQICWVWHGGMRDKPGWGWYDADTGRLIDHYQLLLINPSNYHPDCTVINYTMTITEIPPLSELQKVMTEALIAKAEQEGVVLLRPPTDFDINKKTRASTHAIGRRVFAR